MKINIVCRLVTDYPVPRYSEAVPQFSAKVLKNAMFTLVPILVQFLGIVPSCQV